MDTKQFWASKTFWANAAVAVGSFVPGVSAWIQQNPTSFSLGLSLLNLGLRAITKQGISINLLDKQL
jgi:hypothetical protein